MKILNFEIDINAPVKKVWDTMLGKETYEQWTKVFNETSTYEGEWIVGTKIKFISTEQTGGKSGMYSEIAEILPQQFVSIRHLGVINNDVIDTESAEVKSWTPAYENYRFETLNNGTKVKIEMQFPDSIPIDYQEMFKQMWPNALKALKEICENTAL